MSSSFRTLMSSGVKVKLLFFAKARELVGVTETGLVVPNGLYTQKKLLSIIVETFPVLCSIQGNFIVALNEECMDQSQSIELKEGDQLAVIPPLSGG
ncbi:molybdopterin synthase sulfur carrier subunit-like [Limulus polyphemus]|uniref:Molybdopterin synthase sulfur carrier subunit-like n=1 Tax=Limulus polyphemus TaxID=6850 RepID=A0ABM1TK93_LIMPO|nr:molybdopterin synthase sulfur carrier subunit-like [Limulus polyphemus]